MARQRKGPAGTLSKDALPSVAELALARKSRAEAGQNLDIDTVLSVQSQGYNSYALSVEIGQLFDKLSPAEGKATVFRADTPNWDMACDRAGVDKATWVEATPETKRDMIQLSLLLARDHVYYAMALLKVAQRRAIEVFLECMEDGNKWLRLQAAQSVASLGGLKAASVIEVEQRISGKVEVVFRAPGGAGRELESGTVVTVEPVRLAPAVLEEVASDA